MVVILTSIVLMVVGIPGYTYVYTFYFVWLQKGINHRLMVTSTASSTQVVKSLSQLQAGDVGNFVLGVRECYKRFSPLLVSESSFDFDDSMFFSFSSECYNKTLKVP